MSNCPFAISLRISLIQFVYLVQVAIIFSKARICKSVFLHDFIHLSRSFFDSLLDEFPHFHRRCHSLFRGQRSVFVVFANLLMSRGPSFLLASARTIPSLFTSRACLWVQTRECLRYWKEEYKTAFLRRQHLCFNRSQSKKSK